MSIIPGKPMIIVPSTPVHASAGSIPILLWVMLGFLLLIVLGVIIWFIWEIYHE